MVDLHSLTMITARFYLSDRFIRHLPYIIFNLKTRYDYKFDYKFPVIFSNFQK